MGDVPTSITLRAHASTRYGLPGLAWPLDRHSVRGDVGSEATWHFPGVCIGCAHAPPGPPRCPRRGAPRHPPRDQAGADRGRSRGPRKLPRAARGLHLGGCESGRASGATISPLSQQRPASHRLDRPREHPGEPPCHRQAHPTEVWLPPGQAGEGHPDRPGAGRSLVGGVGGGSVNAVAS